MKFFIFILGFVIGQVTTVFSVALCKAGEDEDKEV